MAEIPIERMPEALAARLDCPVCDGMVRLTLSTNSPGDVAVWQCNGCNSEWHEDGTPRWSIELPVRVVLESNDSDPGGTP